MSVTALADFRRRRAARRAAATGHPTVIGGPNAAVLRHVVDDLMPQGFHAGLWQVGTGEAAHSLRPASDGYERTGCGVYVLPEDTRRAESTLRPCRRCFPS